MFNSVKLETLCPFVADPPNSHLLINPFNRIKKGGPHSHSSVHVPNPFPVLESIGKRINLKWKILITKSANSGKVPTINFFNRLSQMD
ncbi:hypothetical protein BLOT_015026 [Blomia tropicalis]|nr:hypothetical protein BLOT_015026 [Blomia tropicalis]